MGVLGRGQSPACSGNVDMGAHQVAPTVVVVVVVAVVVEVVVTYAVLAGASVVVVVECAVAVTVLLHWGLRQAPRSAIPGLALVEQMSLQ